MLTVLNISANSLKCFCNYAMCSPPVQAEVSEWEVQNQTVTLALISTLTLTLISTLILARFPLAPPALTHINAYYHLNINIDVD